MQAKDQKPPNIKVGSQKGLKVYMKLGTSMQPLSSADKDKGGNKSSVNFLCVYVIAKYDVFLLI